MGRTAVNLDMSHVNLMQTFMNAIALSVFELARPDYSDESQLTRWQILPVQPTVLVLWWMKRNCFFPDIWAEDTWNLKVILWDLHCTAWQHSCKWQPKELWKMQLWKMLTNNLYPQQLNTSSFLTWLQWIRQRWEEKNWSFGIWCTLY